MDTSKNIETMATRSKSSVDMIEDAFIDYITPKTLNTMQDENKCFFSISLENGITITGENPNQVYYFLLDVKHAFFCQYESESAEGYTNCAEEASKYFHMMNNAKETIENHINVTEG